MSSGRGRLREVAVEHAQQVVDLAGVDRGVLGTAFDRDVGGADQREVALVGVDEDHPLVGVLQQVGLAALPELAGDQMAALDQPHAPAAVDAQRPAEHLLDPGAGSVDDGTGLNLPALAVAAVLELDLPEPVIAARADQRRAGQDLRPPGSGVERVQHHEAGIVDPAVGVLETLGVFGLERPPFGIAAQFSARVGGSSLRPPRWS